MEKQIKYYLKDINKEKDSAQVKCGLLIINVALCNGSVYRVRQEKQNTNLDQKLWFECSKRHVAVYINAARIYRTIGFGSSFG